MISNSPLLRAACRNTVVPAVKTGKISRNLFAKTFITKLEIPHRFQAILKNVPFPRSAPF